MCRKKIYRDFLCRMPLLLGIVLWAMIISAGHLAIAFSPLDNIGRSSDLLGRSTIGGRISCLYAVQTVREELVSSGRRTRRPSAAASANFENRYRELLEFKEIHGHTRVPRRHGKLGDWVNKLRQRKDRLEEQRLDRLNEIGFCWDASDDKHRKEREKWWERLESFRQIPQQNLHRMAKAGSEIAAPVDASSSHGGIHQQSSVLSLDNLTNSQTKWLRRQQIEYIDSCGKPSPKLDEMQIQALNEIDPNWWQTVSKMLR
jgi:hypothetical protein